uniref:Uncharacterized protein n=1 Tax=Brassica oleracea TaxID=3712 RepID=A0A3P6DEY5_BRAOL|nr:unnamed protein product [Brassica oleracea]
MKNGEMKQSKKLLEDIAGIAGNCLTGNIEAVSSESPLANSQILIDDQVLIRLLAGSMTNRRVQVVDGDAHVLVFGDILVQERKFNLTDLTASKTGFVSRLEVPKVSDCNSQSKYEKVTLKHNHKFLIKIEIVVSLTLDSSVNLSPISSFALLINIEPWRLGDGYKEFFLDAPDSVKGPNNQGHWLVKSIQCVLDILKNADSNAEGCWCLSHCFPPYPFHGSQYIVWWGLQGSS